MKKRKARFARATSFTRTRRFEKNDQRRRERKRERNGRTNARVKHFVKRHINYNQICTYIILLNVSLALREREVKQQAKRSSQLKRLHNKHTTKTRKNSNELYDHGG